MKSALICTLFLSTTFVYSQTSIIAAKSHSSQATIDSSDPDNFGGPIFCPVLQIESVKYLQPDCIIEKSRTLSIEGEYKYDTICNHPFLQPSSFDLQRIKAMYPDGTKFEDFNEIKKANKKAAKKAKSDSKDNDSSGLIIFLIGGTLFMIYLFIPKMTPSNS